MPRSAFNESGLVRALAELAVGDVPAAKQGFADRLGQWLDFNGALSLYSALNPGAAAPEMDRGKPARTAIRAEFARVRAALAEGMSTDATSGKARIELPLPAAPPEAGETADFEPYHRYYLAHQREMGTAVALLRSKARAALDGGSPALRRLATLDAVMDQSLAARERTLLATIPALLGKRFEHLYAAHRAGRETPETDAPACWMQPGGWLAVFCGEMQAVLRAELALRLQLVAGLIAALDDEVTSGQ